MKKTRAVIIFFLALIFVPGITASAGPVLDRIVQRGELVLGTSGDQPPLTARTKDGKIIGFDADFSRSMASAMGVKLQTKVMPFPELLPALEEGKVDMIMSGMTMTPERNLKVAFVGPYYISGKGILTKIETVASLQDPAEIDRPDLTLAALKNSTSQRFVETVLPKAKLRTTSTLDEAVDMVIQGQVDGLIADYPFCAVYAFRHRDKGLIAGQARFTFEPLGIALPPNDPLLVNWVQNFLGTLKSNGGLDTLTNRWFKNPSWVKELP